MSPLTLLCITLALLFSTAFAANPVEKQGDTIMNAGGVALSADGTLAFVHTISTSGAAVYAVPIPFTANNSGNTPAPYFVQTVSVQYYFIAASISTNPQLIFLVDNQNAQLVSLVYNASFPAANTTLLYNFGITNIDLINGMYYQGSTNLLYFSCYDHFNGANNDFVGVINPYAATPTLNVFYQTLFTSSLAGLAVSSTHLYFGTLTSPVVGGTTIASIYSVPLIFVMGSTVPTILNSSQPTTIYVTNNGNLANATAGNLIYPAGFALNAQESILYIADIGNQDAQAASSPHSLYALTALYSSAPMNLTTLYTYTGLHTEVQQNIALSGDGSTLYFAASGSLNGLYYINNANGSVLAILPPVPAGPSTAAPATSAIAVTSAAAPAATSAVKVSSSVTSTPLPAPTAAPTSAGPPTITLPPGQVTIPFSFSFSDINDALSCLSNNAAMTIGFAASDGGDIFQFNASSASPINPVYIAGTGSSGASFVACQVNPAGTFLYLVDTRGMTLYRYTVATPSVAPVVVATFTSEQVGSLTALAIDFVSQIAYVATRQTANFYTLNITVLGQSISSFTAYTEAADITALALSPDATILYFGSPAQAQGLPGYIYSTPVAAGIVNYLSSPTTVFSSVNLIYPDSILINGTGKGTGLFYKDGGALHAEAGPGTATYQSIGFVVISTSVGVTLFSSTVLDLPSGLGFSPNGQLLYFTTPTTVNTLTLFSTVVPVVPVSSSAFSSSLATSALATSPLITSAPVTSAPVLPTSAPVVPTSAPVLPTSALAATSRLATSAPATSTPPSAVGDPLFAGFLGQRYQVHGIDGGIYAVISQPTLSVNALFVFLESGACPVVDGIKLTNCWSHPGSYFGELTVQTSAGDQLEIVAGNSVTGFQALNINGKAVQVKKGAVITAPAKTMTMTVHSSHSLTLTVDNYRFEVENSDGFVNLISVTVLDWHQMVEVDQPHGLLGQTWRPTSRGKRGVSGMVGVKEVVEGDVDDYVVAEREVFGVEFVYNKFVRSS